MKICVMHFGVGIRNGTEIDMNLFAQQGWQCPGCQKIYSPTTPMCYYCPPQVTTSTGTGKAMNTKMREAIITSMCRTWRHDYGLVKEDDPGGYSFPVSGMTEMERKTLWEQMAQIFDNDITPHMEFKK